MTIVVIVLLAFSTGTLFGALVVRQLSKRLIEEQATTIRLLEAEIAGLKRLN